MIRYVVAVLLATALLGLGFAAVQEVSVVRGEAQVEGEIAAIEDAAVSLLANDDPVPGDQKPPRRVLDVDLPSGGFAVADVDRVVFEPVPGTNRTTASYQLDGKAENTVRIDAPIVNAAPETDTLVLGETTGSVTLVLELVLDDDHGYVVQVAIR